MSAPVFRVSVYDKDRAFRKQIGNPAALVVTPRHNLIGTTDLTLPIGHKALPALLADGARLVVEKDGKLLTSGPITDDVGSGPSMAGGITFTMEDDFRVLRDILGFPNPEGAITAQGVREYCTVTGDAETIIKDLVRRNGVNRMHIPGLVVAPNLHRGAVIPGGVAVRMHPLPDRLFPAVEVAGLGITVKQVGTNLVLDVYEPKLYAHTLSERAGTLVNWKWSRSRPTASRAIIGGSGEGTARTFRALTDTARETQHGMRAETFIDARDAKDDPETGETESGIMDARGQEALTAAGTKNGLSLELAEAGKFYYGTGGVTVGDMVPVDIGAGTIITDVLREAKMTLTTKSYALTEPVVGERIDQPEREVAKAIAALARANRNEKASR